MGLKYGEDGDPPQKVDLPEMLVFRLHIREN
jgi:hypothetical protein